MQMRRDRSCEVWGVLEVYFFFFQAEDGIRDDLVTGVQTCALPIYEKKHPWWKSCLEGDLNHQPSDSQNRLLDSYLRNAVHFKSKNELCHLFDQNSEQKGIEPILPFIAN